ncbi:MAG TPA: CRISPR-associated endonuclease Cas3'', partial [Caldilineaceae bacterium]|nr:CRISPR-associated endonuclease Cas3'' [Caldilineaceae bacterium]
MGRGMSKAERLRELERLYLQRAYSDIEMAERLGVNRTTVYRDRIALERSLPFVEEQAGRWRIERSRYLSQIRLNLAEALSLYLAARRASQQTHIAHIPVASALEKLALSLRQPMTERLVRAAEQILRQRQDPQRTAVFETVAQAWSEQRQLRLHYRALRDGVERVHHFAPYLIEPSPWTDGVYLIGHSREANRLLTLKLDRIVQAALLGPCALPEHFDEQELLRHAWGIWAGEPERVRLRFAPGLAARRLRESVWHPLEQVRELADGGCEWEAPIAEWQEMLPWIRGWGADVEVLEPLELREMLIEESKQMADIYHAPNSHAPNSHAPNSGPAFPYYTLYAKTSRLHEQVHLLLYHLIDVGHVALQLWKVALSQSIRQWLAELLDVDCEAAGRFIAFLAALHDLGKAGPAYQRKYSGPTLQQRLVQAGFILVHPSYSTATQSDVPHGTVSTWSLTKLLTEMAGLPRKFASMVATAIGGHHGAWPAPGATERLDDSGCNTWEQARRDLFWEVRGVFQPPVVRVPATTTELNAFLTVLSALTSISDWIGSREDAFPYVSRPMPTRQYAERAEQQAKDVVAHLGWEGWQAIGDPKGFLEMFPEITTLRPVQQAALDAAAEVALPVLVILEAPTGLGKTEVALALADIWTQRRQTRGVYVAMPTQATSNQMFDRVVRFLDHRYPDSFVNVCLAHGQAGINETLLNLRLHGIGEDVTG